MLHSFTLGCLLLVEVGVAVRAAPFGWRLDQETAAGVLHAPLIDALSCAQVASALATEIDVALDLLAALGADTLFAGEL